MGDGIAPRGSMSTDPPMHGYAGMPQQPAGNTREQGPPGVSNAEFSRRQGQEQVQGHQRGASPMNMESLGSALPTYPATMMPYAQQGAQQTYPSATPSGMMYTVSPMTAFAGQTAPSGPYSQPFGGQPFAQQYQHLNQPRAAAPIYPTIVTSPQRPNFPGAQQFSASPPQIQRATAYQPAFAPSGQPLPHGMPLGQIYQRPGTYGYMPGQGVQDQYYQNVAQSVPAPLVTSIDSAAHLAPGRSEGVSRQSSASSLGPSAPRGPPPKPKQSGHALWIGNLPPNTTIFDLKDHFSREATDDIESVFLISKSNCAFANYKTEAACAAAMQRFNDTRFLGARLVCRLRRMTPATSAAATGTSSTSSSGRPSGTTSAEISSEEKLSETTDTTDTVEDQPVIEATETEIPTSQEPPTRVKEKYFIIKSLTTEDLELSVRNGSWATQAHNEAALNKAFEAAENVFLVFSANKSGEYFGYARMISPISDESAATIEFMPRSVAAPGNEPDMPNKIPTQATTTAPKGYVIDDSARGTIFWEAESAEDIAQSPIDEVVGGGDGSPSRKGQEQDIGDQPSSEAQSFGKPFRIEWISTEKLPFYRTRGLRNPWNANREVKIARDGTELEPSVGRRLVGMFHRPQMAAPSVPGLQPQSPVAAYPMQPFMGYDPNMQPQAMQSQGMQPQARYYQGQ